MTETRPFPSEFEMRQGAGNQHDIARRISEDAIGEVNIATLGVFDGGFQFAPLRIDRERCAECIQLPRGCSNDKFRPSHKMKARPVMQAALLMLSGSPFHFSGRG